MDVDRWDEEEVLVVMAKELDHRDRKEQIASSNRRFWAEEMLMEMMWEKEKSRRDIRRLSRSILLDRVSKTIMTRQLIFSLVEESTKLAETKKWYETEKLRKLEKAKKLVDKEREKEKSETKIDTAQLKSLVAKRMNIDTLEDEDKVTPIRIKRKRRAKLEMEECNFVNSVDNQRNREEKSLTHAC